MAKKCFLVGVNQESAANQESKFKITDAKPYVPVVNLSTEDNIKLIKQSESGFERTINWNKYLSRITNQPRNRYLGFLIDTSWKNRLFLFYHLKM